jgi:carbon monoxide dehydrogenase subunit G
MKLEQSFSVAAPLQRVWDFFLDAQGVSACIPGCQGVEVLGPDSYKASIFVALGPIKTTFNVMVQIVEKQAPTRLVTMTRGEEGSKSSTLHVSSALELAAAGDDQTRVSYASDVAVMGRLGTYGLGVMKKRAMALGEEFANAVRTRLEGANG